MITYTASKTAVSEKKVLQLSPTMQLSLTKAVRMKVAGIQIANFVPATTQIIANDLVIYIDPVVTSDTLKADYIFITHAHADHFWKPEIKKLVKPATLIVAPEVITKELSKYKTKTTQTNMFIDFGRFNCQVVPAYNLKEKKHQMIMHQPNNNFAGYVLSFDSISIYHAGDTDFIPEIRQLTNIDVAIVPIGVGKTAMTPSEAASACNVIHPKYVVPIHYVPGKNAELEFQNLLNKDIVCKTLQQTF